MYHAHAVAFVLAFLLGHPDMCAEFTNEGVARALERARGVAAFFSSSPSVAERPDSNAGRGGVKVNAHVAVRNSCNCNRNADVGWAVMVENARGGAWPKAR